MNVEAQTLRVFQLRLGDGPYTVRVGTSVERSKHTYSWTTGWPFLTQSLYPPAIEKTR